MAARIRTLDGVFRGHQEALLKRDFAGALEHLERYAAGLQPHIEEEERLLLPLYENRGTPIRGAAPELFYGEHEKLTGMLAEFHEAVEALGNADRDPWQPIIALMDREYVFKHLAEHHHEREEKFLFPELDRITTPGERAKILAGFTQAPP